MASIPHFQFNITGATGSQLALSPKGSWRAYILPRGANASADSTGTLITFDSAAIAARFAANDWIQVGLATANLRKVNVVGGNSLSVQGSAVTVAENDRIFLIGSTQPTVVGGSATYTIPRTFIRTRGDDSADLVTNSMITSNSDGLISGYAGPSMYDVIIQDGNQANQGYIADMEVGTVEGVSVIDAAYFGATVSLLAGLSVSGLAVFGQTIAAPNVGGIRYAAAFPGANAGAKIANAIADLPSTGGVVDARGLAGGTFTTNPFSGAPSGTLVLLGAGTFVGTTQIMVPARVTVRGIGKRHTILQADSTFPTGTPLVRLGPGGTGRLFDMRLERLYVHCGGISNSTGVYSTQVNEGSGLFDCLVAKYTSFGVNVESSGGDLPGGLIIRDCEITGGASGSSAGVRLQTLDVGCVFDHITVNTDSAAGPGSKAFDLSSCKVFMSDIHIERHTDGVRFNGGASGVVFNINGAAGVTNLIAIGISCVGGIAIFSAGTNGTANAISDAVTGRTITTSTTTNYILASEGSSFTKAVWSTSNLGDGFNQYSSANVGVARQSFTIGSTQPSVATGNWFATVNVAATTISNFIGGHNGQQFTLQFGDTWTVILHGTSIFNRSSANIASAVNTTRSYIASSNAWFETS